ncbi:MAG: hypothetical protein IPM35_11935 [Myxococcales bacterium]|nr:hypothetical protein [Myxococcales bacterium]
MVLKRVLLAGVLVAACGRPPPPSPPEPPATTTAVPPPDTSTPPALAAGEPARLSCATPLPEAPSFPPAPAVAAPATAGQMSEEAAQAKRLFDGERWPEAISAMERVVSGATGDDAGNRELAEYHRAVALHRAGRGDDAAHAFLQIASRPAHLKHTETVLWIAKLAEANPVVVHGLRHYDGKIAARFQNAQQMETYQTLLFLFGRERLVRGAKAEAAAFFEQVPAESRFRALAAECEKLAQGR